jgi:hypothetical protein
VESTNGRSIRWVEHLTAPEKRGIYTVKVVLLYKDLVAEKSSVLEIK